MKVLIMSDSHGSINEIKTIRKRHENELNYIIHCGDSELAHDAEVLEGVIAVRGNCDYDRNFPDEQVIEIAGWRIYVTHGHKYNVKSSLQQLYYRVREQDINIACFGHTHVLLAENVNGIILLNPASVRLPKLRIEKTYIILELENDQALVSVYEVRNGELISKSRFERSQQ